MSLNRFDIIGNIGSIKTHSGEKTRMEVSVAVNGGYKDKDDNWVDQTHWFNLVVWNPSTIERIQAKYASGDLVLVEGKMVPWKQGEGESAKYGVNFNVEVFRMLNRAEKNKSNGNGDES